MPLPTALHGRDMPKMGEGVDPEPEPVDLDAKPMGDGSYDAGAGVDHRDRRKKPPLEIREHDPADPQFSDTPPGHKKH